MIAIETQLLFDGARLLEGRRIVLLDGKRIAGVVTRRGDIPRKASREILAPEMILAPGLIDLQVNGGGGVLFNDTPTVEGLATIVAAHRGAGTTSLLPTLISASRAQLLAGMAAARAAVAWPELSGVLGLHVEGPFIAAARRGIHPAPVSARPDLAFAGILGQPAPKGAVWRLLVTLAPELADPVALRHMLPAGTIVFAGHSDATYEQIRAFADAEGGVGLAGFTHLFNAMSPLAGRAPGVVGAALAMPDTYAGIIVDGYHVHPGSVAAVLAAKGVDRLFLVSDAMPTVGSKLDRFLLNGSEIRLVGGRLTDAGGTLAGAHLTMAEAVRNLVEQVGVDVADALRMATATPASVLGLRDRGRVRKGWRGDLVVLDAKLRVCGVWVQGIPVHGNVEERPRLNV